jgi:DNA-binding FadR family transcriptional regulator
LFRRANKQLALTEDDRSLLPGLTESFGRIASAVAALSDNQDQDVDGQHDVDLHHALVHVASNAVSTQTSQHQNSNLSDHTAYGF